MSKTAKFLSVLFVLFGFLLTTKVSAEDMKIGYVDFDQIVKRYYKAQMFMENMRERVGKEEAVFQEKVEEINRIKQEMELLSEESRESKTKLLRLKMAEAKNMREAVAQDLQRKKINMMNQIYQEVYAQIDKIGKEEKYTYIFRDKIGTAVIDQPLILFATEKYDLTEKVIEEMNKGSLESEEKEEVIEEEKAEDSGAMENIEEEMPKSLE